MPHVEQRLKDGVELVIVLRYTFPFVVTMSRSPSASRSARMYGLVCPVFSCVKLPEPSLMEM